MNKLSTQQRIQVVAALVEGNSIRSTVRMTGVAKNTVTKLLVDLGEVCGKYQDEVMRNLHCKRIQCDEVWAFCHSKQKNVPEEHKDEFGYGDVWTWTAIDADTKLIPTWFVGLRDAECASAFIEDIAGRLANRVQLTTDGHKVYLEAAEGAFGADIDYAMLAKLYGNERSGDVHYGSAGCTGSKKENIQGRTNTTDASTTYVKRQDLTTCMSMRRFTQLTNGFSKKVEILEAAAAFHFMNYNFCRVHQSLMKTPAMAAGITGYHWTIKDIIGLLEKVEKSH